MSATPSMSGGRDDHQPSRHPRCGGIARHLRRVDVHRVSYERLAVEVAAWARDHREAGARQPRQHPRAQGDTEREGEVKTLAAIVETPIVVAYLVFLALFAWIGGKYDEAKDIDW